MPSAYVLINCEPGSENSIIREVSQIEGIKEVRGTYGVHDIIAKVEVPDMSVLDDAITMKIRRIAGIRSTMTLIVIDSYSTEPYYDLS